MFNRSKPEDQLTRGAAFAEYVEAGYQTIPLHRYSDTKTVKGRKRELGKAPLHKNWTRRHYASADVAAQCERENRNMGVRLRPTDLVIDVDPRNGGDKGFAALRKVIGLDVSQCPTVKTGSGGRHYYFRKPESWPVLDTVKEFPGVEFKSKGRQVVASGSVHPNSNHYVFEPGAPTLEDGVPDAPRKLLELIERPKVATVQGGGQYSVEQLERALECLDPEEFQNHDYWLEFMMGCHHATNGDGRDVFVAWSTSDPKYADDADIVGRRWDSLSADREESSVTFHTLNLRLQERGFAEFTVGSSDEAKDDFEFADDPAEADSEFEAPGDDEFEDPEDGAFDDSKGMEERKSRLEQMNDKYCAVTAGGKYRITYRVETDIGIEWESMNKTDFQSLHENESVVDPRNPEKTVPLGLAWQKWPSRKTAVGTTFNTQLESGQLDSKKRLNLWLGFSIKPEKGKWIRFETMIREDICPGEHEAAEYLLNWIAWKIQNPGLLNETAVAMRGPKGTGKGTLGKSMVRIFGSHAIETARMSHIAGNFNGHMEYALFCYSDEAFWSGDPQQESTIKKLITDERTQYEHKGITAYRGINRTSLMFGSNNDWVVPAGEGERRYCVVRTSDAHQCPEGEPNHPNRKYWDAINRELDSGGLAAFMYDMQQRPLPKGWHPRGHVPLTKELANQKAQGFGGVVGFYFDRLQSGEILETLDDFTDDWQDGELRVRPTAFWEACRHWVRETHPRKSVTCAEVREEMKRFGWDAGDHLRHGKHRDRYWLCPDLATARKNFDAIMKGSYF